METVKASEVQICIFTANDLPKVSDYPPDEQAIYQAFAGVITDLRTKHGTNLPVYLEFCPLNNPQNQILASNIGLTDFPAVQVFAFYPDDRQVFYGLGKDLGDKFTGVNWKADDVRPYVEAVLYQRKPAETSILCQIFPPLCNVGAYIWLAAAAYSTYRFSESKEAGKIAWGAAAGLTWQSFFAGGGFKKLGL